MVPEKHTLEKLNIISSYHHSFAGGSKNTSRLLHYLSQNGCNVDAFFFETPQYFTYTRSKVKTYTFNSREFRSDVIDTNGIKNYSAADKIIHRLKSLNSPILFGANLFPYCNILHDVKSQIRLCHNLNPKLIIHPVGSDIWQIGAQMKTRVKWLIDNPLVDTVVTYSESFVSEIKEYFDIKRHIHVLPPVLEKDKFFPISDNEKSERRKLLGFDDSDFIIHHHSSMRKIKCPETILEIALKSSQLISERCILIMAGPVPHEEIISLNLKLESSNENDIFKYKTDKGNLTIYWTGILSDVEYLMQVSDLELNASIHDSFNLSLMEAMACGIAVVTSDVVGINGHITKSGAGTCFPTKKLLFHEINEIIKMGHSKKHLFNIDYAVDAVSELAKNRTATRLIGLVGASYVANEFSIERASKEFYKYIS